MIRNGLDLLKSKPLDPMLDRKVKLHGVSHGLAEVGYDIQIKQDVTFYPAGALVRNENGIMTEYRRDTVKVMDAVGLPSVSFGRFTIASALERFEMPNDLVGIVHDKSTWARRGLSVFNTVIEPAWKGYLTLELVYHGSEILNIPAGCGIAQVIFHEITNTAAYDGKYQNQENKPVSAIYEVSETFHKD